jgi:hypothetical protein
VRSSKGVQGYRINTGTGVLEEYGDTVVQGCNVYRSSTGGTGVLQEYEGT